LSRTAARILVDQLLVHGVDTAYCVPGESYLGVLDAIGDSPIRLYTTRHEAAAANMAEAYGKLTGRPGLCLVTRALALYAHRHDRDRGKHNDDRERDRVPEDLFHVRYSVRV